MADNYLEKNRGFITASKIKLFLDSPEMYKAVYVDEVDTSNIKIPETIEDGKMVDEYLLSPEVFHQNYFLPEGKMLKADYITALMDAGIGFDPKETVEQLKTKLVGDKTVVTPAKTDMLKGILNEVSRQPLWSWKPGDKEYQHQVDLVMEYRGEKIKGTLDRLYLDEEKGEAIIRDLKTSSSLWYNTYAKTTQFVKDLSTTDPFHYKLQMAMYVKLIQSTYPTINKIKVIIDAVATKDPYYYEAIEYDIDELVAYWSQIESVLDTMIDWKEANYSEEYVAPAVRAALAGNRYYKLDVDDAIQKEFTQITTVQPIE